MAQIHVKHATLTFVMEVVNISRGGMLVALGDLATPPWVRLEQPLELVLYLAEELDNLQLAARVVRIEPERGRFAVAFEAVDAAIDARLDWLLARVHGRPLVPPPLPRQ